MSKRFNLVLIAIATLAGSGWIFYQSQNVIASQTLPSLSDKATLFQQDLTPIAPDDPSKLAADELKAITTQWSNSLLQGAGWVHLISQHTSDQDEGGTFPDGRPIPLSYIMDEWYQLDEQNQVVAVISIMKDHSGQPVQVGTFREGIWQNLAFGTKSEGEADLYLDFGFSKNVEQAMVRGNSFVRYEALVGDQPVVTFAIGENFDQPLNIMGYTKPVISVENQATFDLKSGQLLSLERVFVMNNGEQRVAEKTIVLTMERATTPPTEVSELLKLELVVIPEHLQWGYPV